MSGTNTIRIISILLFSLLTAALAPAQERSYTLLREGNACGTVDLVVERLQNGYVQYRLREERSVITVADRHEQRLRTLTILADTALRIVSLNGIERAGSREWRIHGSCVNGMLHLSRVSTSGRAVRWRSDCAAVPDIMLPELIRRGVPRLPDKVFDTRDLEDRRVAITIAERADGGYSITVDRIRVYEVDAGGLLESWNHVDHGLAWIPNAETGMSRSPCDLDCGVFWDLGQALLPTSTDNIRSMKVVLRLSEQVGARLELLDPRQEVRIDADAPEQAVSLTIRNERARFEDANLPIRDARLLPYLQADSLLPLSSDLLRERAAMLRDWDRNAANIARSIVRWCGEEFILDEFVPVVSADRLVREPRGTALHAAILFVALARKAGVPARFVLGLEPQGGRWRSTVWAEAWSGAWVPVDPLGGDILDDAQHIKLLHSADVAGLRTQAARLKSALRVELQDIEPIDPSATGALQTGIMHGTYTNRRFRCSFDAPEGWILEERELGEEIVVTAVPELGSAVRFELHLLRNPYRLHTQELYETRVRTLRGVLKGLAVEEKGELKFGDRRAPYLVYSYLGANAEGFSRRVRTADCTFSIGTHGYLLHFTAPAERFDAYQEHLESILRSLRLYD